MGGLVSVRLGVSTPVVLDVPGRSADWEAHAGISDIARIAEAADRLGFHHLTCSEHVALPENPGSAMLGGSRGTRYWDPLATLSYIAARTSRIGLCTAVLVLGYHHPLAIAKRFGTLDRISGGRLMLGVGVGSLTEEFDLLGVPFADRARRADDAIAAIRAAIGRRKPEYHGPYYSFSDLVVDPHAVTANVPIWIGGNTPVALRRATALADGWLPSTMSPETLRDRLAQHALPCPGFEIVVSTADILDPIAAPEQAVCAVEALADAGATIVQPRLRHESLEHYLEQLDAMTRLSCFSAPPAARL